MKKLLAFTIVEMLIVVSLIAILSVAVLSLIHPKEQTNRATDTNIFKFATEIFLAIDRYDTNQNTPPFNQTFSNIYLNSESGLQIIQNLVDTQEIKSTALDSKFLDQLLFTGQPAPLQYSICFQPQSSMYRQDQDKCGYYKPDINDGCFVCISNISDDNTTTPTPTIAPTNIPQSTPTQSQDICDLTDYPPYPCTSFYASDDYAEYGCDRFQIDDRSCNEFVWRTWNTPCASICQPGERCLKKIYTAFDFLSPEGQNCYDHIPETTEYYCVGEPYANCTGYPGISTDYGFNFGCTNPMRAIEWKPEYL